MSDFIVQFPQTRVRYEYDSLSDVHFIEVVPSSVYHLDDVYIGWETKMYDKFVALYPDQNICFISDDALVGLENVQVELIGAIFESIRSIRTNEIIVKESEISVAKFNRSCIYINFTSNTNTSLDAYSLNFTLAAEPDYSLAA